MSKRPRDPVFTDLPTELMPSIGSYLPTSDYSAFRGTSRAVHAQLPTCKTLIPEISSCVKYAYIPYPQCKDYCSQYLGAFSVLAMLELCANFRSTSKGNVITRIGDVKVSRFINQMEGEILIEYRETRRTGFKLPLTCDWEIHSDVDNTSRFEKPLICDWQIFNNFDNTFLFSMIYPILGRRIRTVSITFPEPDSVNVEDLIEDMQDLLQNLPWKIVDMKLRNAEMTFLTGNEELDDEEVEDMLTDPRNVARYNLDSDVRDEEIAFDPDFPNLSRFFIPEHVTDQGDNFGFFSHVTGLLELDFNSISITDKIKQRIIEVFRPL